MTLLVRHPETPPGAIVNVDAELVRTPDGATATFRAIGDLSRLIVPAPATSERTDNLWKTTCFEIFEGGEGAEYREYNLSPSGQWACYAFDRTREGMREAPAEVTIETVSDSRSLSLVAKIKSEFPNPAWIGLSAVIEEADGALRYWAVSFAPGKPDFHAKAARALLLDGVDAQ